MRAIIETERLRLRPLQTQDLDRIVTLANNLDVTRWLTVVPYPYTHHDAEEFLQIAQNDHVWAVCLLDELIGVIGKHGAEIGYWLGQEYWGHGYMTEAALAIVQDHFSRPSAGVLTSGYFIDNDRSSAVLRKLGFSNLGTPVPTQSAATGTDMPLQKMALTPEQWHFLHPLTLHGDGLVIAPVIFNDADALYEIFKHKKVAENMASFDHPLDMSAINERIETGRWKGAGNGWFKIEDSTENVVGAIGFHTISDGLAGIGYATHPDAWGQGIMTRAVAIFTKFLFARYGFAAIEAEHFVDNPASGKVLIKNGFEKHGESMGKSKARLEPAPVNIYRLANPK